MPIEPTANRAQAKPVPSPSSQVQNRTHSKTEVARQGVAVRRVWGNEEIAAEVVDCGYQLHLQTGPGLLETVYEVAMAHLLEQRGLKVERQILVPIELFGTRFDEGFRADLLVEGKVLIELKSVETLAPVHAKQVLTYLRLLNLSLGFLINFGDARYKDGIHRIVNQHPNDGPFTRSR
ncbi:MAG: GxxExxY protein [Opitutaceae bacterium]|nr:GxxExxY protein [Opitutaceae bacterium]